MNLWFCGLLLVGFVLSSSAQSVEECRQLVTPHSTFQPSFGRWNFIMGWITSGPFKNLFKTVLTQWIEFRPATPENPLLFVEDIGIRHTTYCKYGSSPVTLHRNMALTDKSNFTCTYHSLPTCEKCLLFTVNSRHNNNLLPLMNITNPTTLQEVSGYRAVYLMSTEKSLPESDLEHFKKQASCLGFSGDPDFFFNVTNTFCVKGEE